MRALFFDKDDLHVYVKNSKIYYGSDYFPLKECHMVVISSNISLESQDILRLSYENIAILYINKISTKFALTLAQKSKNSELKLIQFEARRESLTIAKYFICKKMHSHFHLPLKASKEMWLELVNNATTIQELQGYEGAFAAMYFSHYFDTISPHLHKGKRSKQPPLDCVNAMLSFLYSMAYNLITSRLYIAGFEPSISYLHTPFRSHYALASDFMELFRAEINIQIALLFNEKVLVKSDFSFKNGVFLKYTARKKIWVYIRELMYTIDKSLSQEIAEFKALIIPKQTSVA